jgi:hypothetical protein
MIMNHRAAQETIIFRLPHVSLYFKPSKKRLDEISCMMQINFRSDVKVGIEIALLYQDCHTTRLAQDSQSYSKFPFTCEHLICNVIINSAVCENTKF